MNDQKCINVCLFVCLFLSCSSFTIINGPKTNTHLILVAFKYRRKVWTMNIRLNIYIILTRTHLFLSFYSKQWWSLSFSLYFFLSLCVNHWRLTHPSFLFVFRFCMYYIRFLSLITNMCIGWITFQSCTCSVKHKHDNDGQEKK